MPALVSRLASLRRTRNLAVVSMLAGIATLTYVLTRGSDRLALREAVDHPWYIDTTGHTFRHPLRPGQPAATTSPNGHPAYPAELCYWTPAGKPKTTPTLVLLNRYAPTARPPTALAAVDEVAASQSTATLTSATQSADRPSANTQSAVAPTYCPDCRRLVVANNPPPDPTRPIAPPLDPATTEAPRATP